MLPPNLPTPRAVVQHYNTLYSTLTSPLGPHTPFLYPWAGLGAFLALAYLLLDHRHSRFLASLRWPVCAAVWAFQGWCVVCMRARHPAAAFGVGLLSAWGCFWVGVLVGVGDAQGGWWRIERRVGGSGRGRVRDATAANGTVAVEETPDSISGHGGGKDEATDSLYWQSYPTHFGRERIDWVADAFCSFRGVGWNVQTSVIPPLPRPASLSIPTTVPHESNKTMTVSRVGIRRFRNQEDLLSNTIANLIIGYIVLDVVKCLMHRDAYFWGYMDASAPTYLPLVVQRSHVLLKSWRLLISLTGVYTCLWEIFRLGPAFFSGVLRPKWVGVRGEAWMNPADMYGSFTCVLDDGLAGWWGGWWHQVFRLAFEMHAKWVLRTLGIEQKSTKGRIISLFVAFFMSGCLHACGSYTQLGDTRPFLGPFRFFMLQFVGILLQLQSTNLLRKAGVLEKVPKSVRWICNFVSVHVWLYHTAPLLMDDFAKGGIWLFEPIAFSPLRALGFGAKDDGFFCWWNGLLFWRSGQHWWDTGIAI